MLLGSREVFALLCGGAQRAQDQGRETPGLRAVTSPGLDSGESK